MSNEHHDVVCQRAVELGFVVDHVARPADEHEAGDALFVCVTNNAFAGRPSIMEAGLRVVIMAARLGLTVLEMGRAERVALRRVALGCHDGLRVPGSVNARAVFELILGQEQTAWRIGRRASLLAYALNRSVIIRGVLESFEVIGGMWGLSATNKRSAVSAAMNKLRAELVQGGQLPRHFRFWFEKTADARAVYEQAQVGNHNRAGAAESSCYDLEEVDGLRLKPRFARMNAAQRREVLRAMHEASEMKRLLGSAPEFYTARGEKIAEMK